MLSLPRLKPNLTIQRPLTLSCTEALADLKKSANGSVMVWVSQKRWSVNRTLNMPSHGRHSAAITGN
jgi:hypothetical protein